MSRGRHGSSPRRRARDSAEAAIARASVRPARTWPTRAGVSRTTVSFVLNGRHRRQDPRRRRGERVLRGRRASSATTPTPRPGSWPAAAATSSRSSCASRRSRSPATPILAETLRGLAAAARTAGFRVMVEPLVPTGRTATYDAAPRPARRRPGRLGSARRRPGAGSTSSGTASRSSSRARCPASTSPSVDVDNVARRARRGRAPDRARPAADRLHHERAARATRPPSERLEGYRAGAGRGRHRGRPGPRRGGRLRRRERPSGDGSASSPATDRCRLRRQRRRRLRGDRRRCARRAVGCRTTCRSSASTTSPSRRSSIRPSRPSGCRPSSSGWPPDGAPRSDRRTGDVRTGRCFRPSSSFARRRLVGTCRSVAGRWPVAIGRPARGPQAGPRSGKGGNGMEEKPTSADPLGGRRRRGGPGRRGMLVERDASPGRVRGRKSTRRLWRRRAAATPRLPRTSAARSASTGRGPAPSRIRSWP